MPQMANITVKKADGTTDVVYTALTPSAGDRVAARWRANAVSSIPSHRPIAELVSRDNGDKTGRRLNFHFVYPVLATISGVEQQIGLVPIDLTAMVPQGVDSAQVSEGVAQALNLLNTSLIKTSIVDGYAPT